MLVSDKRTAPFLLLGLVPIGYSQHPTRENLSLAAGMPTNRAEPSRRVCKTVGRFYPTFDDHSTIRTGSYCDRGGRMLLFNSHESPAWYWIVSADCRRPT